MGRLVALGLTLSLVSATPALAGETLLQSATRAAETLARSEPSPSPRALQEKVARGGLQAAQAQQQPGLESTGMRRRTKLMIAVGVAAAFAAIAYSIDHGDVNNTPSTLGTRKD